MLVSPEAVSMTRGAPLLHGLELGGPYAALLVGAAWALIGWGLLRLYDWARLAVLQGPSASFGAISSCGKFFSDGPCKQQIPRTLLPRERSCERLGMTRILGFYKSNRRSRTGGKPLRTNRCRATLDWAGEGTRPYVSIAWINIIAS